MRQRIFQRFQKFEAGGLIFPSEPCQNLRVTNVLPLRVLEVCCVFAAYCDILKAFRTEGHYLPVIVRAMHEFRNDAVLHISVILTLIRSMDLVPEGIHLG